MRLPVTALQHGVIEPVFAAVGGSDRGVAMGRAGLMVGVPSHEGTADDIHVEIAVVPETPDLLGVGRRDRPCRKRSRCSPLCPWSPESEGSLQVVV